MAKPGVLNGGTVIRVPRPGAGDNATGDDKWQYYTVYELPPGSGQYASYRFENREQMEAILPERKMDEIQFKGEKWFNRNVTVEGDLAEITGVPGNWRTYVDQITREAADRAGVRDPGLLGRIMSNPEMQTILAQATIGEWTPQQVRAAQRQTKFWTKELYPGIENLYNNTQNPEQAYNEYLDQVTPALQALGYSKEDGSYKNQIKKMLNKKIDSAVFLSQVPTFIRAKQNSEFALILDEWADRTLGRNVGFKDWFDLLAGESVPDLDKVAERATLAWVAQNQGTTLSNREVRSIAKRTELSPDEAQRAFSDFNQNLLALGDEALGRYGLTRDEVLSASVGVAPASGRSLDEIKLMVAKTAREQGLADDDKINFYVGFSPSGTPTRPGLEVLRPEGA